MQLLSRHSNFSIVIITQNLYEQGKECRNIRYKEFQNYRLTIF